MCMLKQQFLVIELCGLCCTSELCLDVLTMMTD